MIKPIHAGKSTLHVNVHIMYRSIPNKNLCTEVVCTEIDMYPKRPTPMRG